MSSLIVWKCISDRNKDLLWGGAEFTDFVPQPDQESDSETSERYYIKKVVSFVPDRLDAEEATL